MIYAFVISHLLKQGVNVFVPLHQSSLQRQRGNAGADVLEQNGKVNQAICFQPIVHASQASQVFRVHAARMQLWKTIGLWLICKPFLSSDSEYGLTAYSLLVHS